MSTAIGQFEQLLLLAVLRLGKDAYGMNIRRAIEETTGRNVSAGAMYTALGRLEGRGLVHASDGEPSPERTGQRRRYYRVEPTGAQLLYRNYRELEAMTAGVVPELERLAARAGKVGS